MRLRVIRAAATLMLILPAASQALGLGDIQLRSALNAPLDAEIELLDVTDEEFAGLRAQLASRETFSRYGLDYPAYLSGLSLRTARGSNGRPVIRITSSAAMTEPFATLLVEANWARGRLLREYTVLLDPPVFAPPPASGTAPVPAPVAAPTTGAGERSAPIARPAPVQPAAPPATGTAGSYNVRRGDTLAGIAQAVAPGAPLAERRRVMLAIFRGNAGAFDGNINVLRSGAVLRLPDEAALAAIDPAEASAEVRRQSANWRAGSGTTTASTEPQLRLVPPGGGAGSGAATGAATAELQRRVTELESQLADSRRLLDLRNAELARLQAAASGQPKPAPSAAPPAGTTPAPTAAVPAPAEPTAPTTETVPPAPATGDVPPPAAEVAPEAQPAVEAPVVAKPAPASTVVEEEGPSLVDRLLEFWFVPAGLAVLLLGFFGLRFARRRREESLAETLGSLSTIAAADPALRDAATDTLPLRKRTADAFVVEESGSHQRPTFATGAPRVTAPSVTVEDTEPGLDLSGAGSSLDQGDPLAEADFHMAYGLYDQAADLVRLALQKDPQRRDLRLKLLEVFFVWGNREQFLQTARELAVGRENAQPGEWEKVVIMGKQLAPDDELFSQSMSGAGAGGVDLNLEGGQNRIDFDLMGEPSVVLSPESVEGVDLDLGAAFGDRPGDKADGLSADLLDFPLDDPGRGADFGAQTATTRQMIQPLADDDGPTLRFTPDSDGPTVEQPQLDGGQTVRTKLETQQRFGATPSSPSEQTAELALDDLGLDLSSLEGADSSLLESTGSSLGLDAADAPTMLAGLDDTSRRLISESQADDQPTLLAPTQGGSGQGTGTWMFNESDFLDPVAARREAEADAKDPGATQAIPSLPDLADLSPTSQLRALEAELDLNLNEDTGLRAALGDPLAVTGASRAVEATGEFPLDLDVGLPRMDLEEGAETQRFTSTEVLPDLEPVTMSEVGTKLDLARAYMDMGDPEGARSILSEVLQEGSSNQKQEAQRLLDSIPG